MSSILPLGPDGKTNPIRDAAFNAVAVASLAYQREVATLTTILNCAHGHGLTVPDLCSASGLDADFVRRLLAEVG